MEQNNYKCTIGKFFRHLNTVNKHRFKVFCLCCKVGIPWRGLVHDLSKYSPTEFWEGVKYYQGTYSPITNCKKEKGYSEAWLHHFGRNKHHYEYWVDYAAPVQTPIIPYCYFAEMLCDTLAAGMTYQGKNWTKEYQLSYWKKTEKKRKMNPKIEALLTKIYTDIAKDCMDKVLSKKNLQKLYQEYTKE